MLKRCNLKALFCYWWADTYASKILDRELRAKEFDLLCQLIATVPVRRIHPNKDAARIEDLCKVIRVDYDSLNSNSPAQS